MELIIPVKYRKLVDASRLALVGPETLQAVGKTGSEEFTLKITDNKTIQKLNHAHRGFDEPTDVLSFENEFLDPETGNLFIGDIVISLEKAQQQSAEHGNRLQAELDMLLVHGLLHLCGMDHAEAADFQEMSRLQDVILKKIDNPLLGSIHEP